MNPAIGLCALRSIHVVINYSKFIISLQIYFKYIKKIKKKASRGVEKSHSHKGVI